MTGAAIVMTNRCDGGDGDGGDDNDVSTLDAFEEVHLWCELWGVLALEDSLDVDLTQRAQLQHELKRWSHYIRL